ncbi:NACHT domain-containing protein [Thalassotalea marina]|uniref:NACHT domain-containing protein n=1 Tax=Thalassotalea marina TaxID=1673741 RepID=A0A919BKM6_9GAMM|nr:NACHT domain-containing protein [Thalassotalea marina]GHF98303.1 hypothetical protein GCM10017161_28450 [Thalassotalea marina]
MPLLESIALKSLTVLATSITKKFTERGWSALATEFEAAFTRKSITDYCKACNEYVNLRTLYSSQHDIFIDDVYVPLFMSPTNDDEVKIEITNLSFYSSGITNIIGQAGQGKSTFLRKMLINELTSGKHLPVFFELKYLDCNEPLLNQIVNWFKRHGINSNNRGIGRLLKSGYIKLFLDGFDEMPPSSHDLALEKIKDLSRDYPDTTIIVTTRPDTLITTESYISNYKVLNLTIENVNQLFLNISNNNVEATKDAMAQIEKYPRIKSIVKTPILAILLFITYRAWSKIPDNLSDFYKKIFITLLTHHDSLKSGRKIDRGIDIPLNDYQIEETFSIFCFRTFSEGLTSFSIGEATHFMKQALDSEAIEEVCPKNLVEVIKQCTGIICSNGYDDLTFSHKSLQEYYTALYIKQQSLYDKRNFYKSVQNHLEESKYNAVLEFLKGIDTYDYVKYYYIPCFQEMFDIHKVDVTPEEETISRGLVKVFESISVPFIVEENGDIKDEMIGLSLHLDNDSSTYFYVKLIAAIAMSLDKLKLYSNYIKRNKQNIVDNADDNGESSIGVIDIIANVDDELAEKFTEVIEGFFDKVILTEHEYLIKKHNQKKKPSLLKQVFDKKKKAAESA